MHCSYCVPGTNAYTPPEYISTGRYDGCQGTVWQVGILLVEILSPYMPFNKPEHALEMGPRIPEQLSSGDKLEYYYNFSLLNSQISCSNLWYDWRLKERAISNSSLCSRSKSIEHLEHILYYLRVPNFSDQRQVFN